MKMAKRRNIERDNCLYEWQKQPNTWASCWCSSQRNRKVILQNGTKVGNSRVRISVPLTLVRKDPHESATVCLSMTALEAEAQKSQVRPAWVSEQEPVSKSQTQEKSHIFLLEHSLGALPPLHEKVRWPNRNHVAVFWLMSVMWVPAPTCSRCWTPEWAFSPSQSHL